MNLLWIRWLFVLSGNYDLMIGLVFLCWGPGLFDAAGVPQPNHWSYLQFASLLLMTFGVMFFAVAVSPGANRNLIPFGMLLKLSYISVAGYYWAVTDVPVMFKPFAIIDLIMLILFCVAYRQLGERRA